MTPLRIYDSQAIDLDRHAVIEASAGTGKTYTLEHLVLRLLIEKRLRLDQILVVTFTEKATGELLERIRVKLVEEIQHREESGDEAARSHLQEALNTFDTAAIFTIHGFCQRMLKQFAFENREIFDNELVDDPDIYKEALYEIMRSDWRQRFGDALPLLLQLEDYNEKAWERTVLDLAGRFRPQNGDLLLPQDCEIPAVTDAQAIMQPHLEELHRLVGPITMHDLAVTPFMESCAEVLLKPACTSIIMPLLKLLAAWQQGTCHVAQVGHFLVQAQSHNDWSPDDGFQVLTSSFKKGAEKKDHFTCQTIEKLIPHLDALRQDLHLQHASALLTTQTVRELHTRATRLKAERGAISYNDMLERLDRSLHESPDLRQTLREQYPYALIDEFQDTDPIQWSLFQQVFLNSDDNRLIIIGDPKQAIYSFRGADVYTYLQARRILQVEHGAQLYELPTNYRAVPELIEACNTLFANPTWFAPDDDIRFSPVQPPAALQAEWLTEPERPAMSVIPVGGSNKAARNRGWFAFIAADIKALLDAPPRLRRKQDERYLAPDDICVLVRAKKDGLAIMDILHEAGVPTTFYKKPGLYESEEARHLMFMLQAIAEPDRPEAVRRALLTRFFAVSPHQLAAMDELPPQHPASRRLEQWSAAARKRHWPQLFQALFQESGILLREAQEVDGDRRVTNYRHLAHELELLATRDKLDIADLANQLRFRRENAVSFSEEEGLHQQESETPKVAVITIHKSKGLEFPIVFIGSGFTTSGKDPYYLYHDEQKRRTFDLSKKPDHKSRHKLESESEDKRLYYVAITRASHRVYIPYAETTSYCNGPLGTFIHSALDHLPHAAASPRQAPEQPAAEPPSAPPAPPDLDAWPELTTSFSGRAIKVDSFTSLHNREERYQQGLTFETEARWKEDEQANWEVPGQPDDELPAGPNVGSMFHDVLEHIDYALVGDVEAPDELLMPGTESQRLIDDKLAAYYVLDGLDRDHAERCRLRVADVVHKTLTSTLNDEGFCLADIPADDRLHELEFYYPGPLQPGESLPEDVHIQNSMLHGYIDLVFRRHGRFYLLDWKSNLLDYGYDPAGLARCMDESNYHLQYKLYTIALQRWLKHRLPDFSFGGVYYLFLRGMNGRDAATGVFHSL